MISGPGGALSKNFAIYASSSAHSYFAGNVGIGTTSPNAKLEIQTASADSIQEGLRILNPNTGTSAGSSIGFYQGAETERARIATKWDLNAGKNALYFYTGAVGSLTESMTINGNGAVGIGTTNPAYPLSIANDSQQIALGITGDNATSKQIYLENTNAAGNSFIQTKAGSNYYSFGTVGSDGSFRINNASVIGSGDEFTMLSGGNVGIGTTTPGYKLDVNGDINIAAASALYIGGGQL